MSAIVSCNLVVHVARLCSGRWSDWSAIHLTAVRPRTVGDGAVGRGHSLSHSRAASHDCPHRPITLHTCRQQHTVRHAYHCWPAILLVVSSFCTTRRTHSALANHLPLTLGRPAFCSSGTLGRPAFCSTSTLLYCTVTATCPTCSTWIRQLFQVRPSAIIPPPSRSSAARGWWAS